jgi:hypothetical protein
LTPDEKGPQKTVHLLTKSFYGEEEKVEAKCKRHFKLGNFIAISTFKIKDRTLFIF